MEATQGVTRPYFQLPVAGTQDLIYRERVYCYELYHQMRSLWPFDCQFSLSGEIDKAGHPLVRGNNLDAKKPDFLVHVPGDMGGNYAVVEVKPVNAGLDGVKKDLDTLAAFRQLADYERGLLLVYGEGAPQGMQPKILEHIRADRRGLEIWAHRASGERARKLDFNKA